MALVTGLPNFFNAAGPVASDFNNAAKALLAQVGGAYYDEALVAQATVGGNLDTTNLSASAAIRNYQKAESGSLMFLYAPVRLQLNTNSAGSTSWAAGDIGLPSQVQTPLPVIGPVAAEVTILSVQTASREMVSGAGVPQWTVDSGSFDAYLNGYRIGTFKQQVTARAPNGANSQNSVPMGMTLRTGDFLYFDFGNTFIGTDQAFTGPVNIALSVSVYCRARHVR